MTDSIILRPKSRAVLSDADFEAVREMAAQGRPIPAIIMAAIVERIEANAEPAAPAVGELARPPV